VLRHWPEQLALRIDPWTTDIVFNYSTVDIAKLRGCIFQVELPGVDKCSPKT
jgi:hypothetical protein